MILEVYKKQDLKATENLTEIYKATDLNNDGFISCEEFVNAFRNIHSYQNGKEYAILLFKDYYTQINQEGN